MKWTKFTALSALLTLAVASLGLQTASAQTSVYSADSNPRELVVVNGVLFFAADDGLTGQELWKSDGTEAGTVQVLNIQPNAASSILDSFTEAGDYLFFSFRAIDSGQKNSELWRSDGTALGTIALKSAWEDSSVPKELTEMGSTLYFSPQSFLLKQLWKSDGTPLGTQMIKDFDVGMHAIVPNNLTVVNGVLYFTAGDDVFNNELWKSDGTAEGTLRVAILDAASDDTHTKNLTDVGGTLYFASSDTVNGSELWKSDGTDTGTSMVKNIAPGISDSDPHELTDVNGVLYFAAKNGGSGVELWKSSGSALDTVRVKNINAADADSNPTHLTNVGGTLFFVADDGMNGAELWISDGTAPGTKMLKDITSGTLGSDPDSFLVIGSRLYFAANDGASGKELWRSDGTEAGTYMIKDIQAGKSGSSPASFTAMNGDLYFTASNGITGVELWKSDGNFGGTLPVRDINANAPIFQIITPNGGETLDNNSEINITWRKISDSINNVKIELFKGGLFYLTIADSTENDGSYTWTVPLSLERASDYSITISFVSDPNILDSSDSDFSVAQPAVLLNSVTDDGGGLALLQWNNPGAPPAQFLGLAYDLYAKTWVRRGTGGGMWYIYPRTAAAGNMDLGYTGAYFTWLFSQEFTGSLVMAKDPTTVLMYSGQIHTPTHVTATNTSGKDIELKWDPEYFGTWLYWIIVYDTTTRQPVASQGPLGNAVWHYVAYGDADYTSGKTQITAPASGSYWVFISGMGWDGSTRSSFASPLVQIP